eukprot:CFRG5820T1
MEILTVLLLVQVLASAVDACSCLYVSNHEQYCTADFVVVGNVVRDDARKSITVSVSKGLKGILLDQETIDIQIGNPDGPSTSCDILPSSFSENIKYLITGYTDRNGVNRPNPCGVVQKWSLLTKEEQADWIKWHERPWECGVVQSECPTGCKVFYDGCNDCQCDSSGNIKGCTKIACLIHGESFCKETLGGDVVNQKCPVGCKVFYDGCNDCQCDNNGNIKGCTKKACLIQEEPFCKETFEETNIVTCATILCAPGHSCIQLDPTMDAMCVSDSPIVTCASVTCAHGHKCIQPDNTKDATCVTDDHVVTCAAIRCDLAYKCEQLDPKHDATCIPDGPVATCASVLCEQGYICVQPDPTESAMCVQGDGKPSNCPPGCKVYNDGCNTCTRIDNEVEICTLRACLVHMPPFCQCHETRPDKCDLECLNGYVIDDDGCATCKCEPTKETPCSHNCIMWNDGCNLCQCGNEPGEMLSCTERMCIHQGTPKCECYRGRPDGCDISCGSGGYLLDDNECSTCECNEDPNIEQITTQ